MRTPFNKKINMTEGGIFSNLFAVALPLAISGVLQLLFNAADLIVVGRFSDTPNESIAAVGSNGSLISLIINLALGLSVGANVVMAQALGAKDADRAHKTVHTAVFVGIVCGILMGTIVLLGAPAFLTWMKSPAGIIGKATQYIRNYAV